MQLITLIILSAVLAGCAAPAGTVGTATTTLPEATAAATLTPFQPEPTATAGPKTITDLKIYIDQAVPERIRAGLPENLLITEQPQQADLTLGLSQPDELSAVWIYAVVGPFPMIADGLSLQELRDRWTGTTTAANPIVVAETTRKAMTSILGEPGGNAVEVVAQGQLVDKLWLLQDAIAIVPFEDLEPRLKVLSINNQTPISNQFDASSYPLFVSFGWNGSPEALGALKDAITTGEIAQLSTNRDPHKLTVLAMTGVTALVRATATRMEQMGMTYPGRDIRDWLVNADLTHISNEVSFTPTCPNPDPNQVGLMFCSKPEYLQLLDDVGTDILDLTGNHELDWGREPFEYSLGLYKQRGWAVYAGGMNLEQARAAVTIEHNGNRFAFIGCNPAGPPFDWATETLSGVANCDYPWIHAEIQRLKEQGYIVIMTYQYFESYRANVESFEETDFRGMADAGATIVSGSQAHHPMAMEFYGGSFIHYGLGNLFFDQMFNETYTIPMGTRKEFVDRHVFYDGKYISTQLLTALLEDFARPRPMTTEERQSFLQEIFVAGGWTPGAPWSFQLK